MPSSRLVQLRLAALCTTLAAAFLSTPLSAQEKTPGYDEALARYKECIDRLVFRHHTEGRQRLAETRSLDGLKILVEDYAKAKRYPEYSRYTMATLFSRSFKAAEAVPMLSALRKAQDKLVDMWLWYHVLRLEIDHGGEADIQALVTGSKNHTHRAVAIAALGSSKDGNIRDAIVSACADFPKKESDRMVLLGAMTGALFENKARVNTEEYRTALKAYIGLLAEDVGLTHTAKVQMARHLQWILRGPAMFVNPEPWFELLERGEIKAPPRVGTSSAPSFFGVETDGERICYVVDMSDSMCKKITKTPEMTGPRAAETGQRKVKVAKKAVLDEGDLPWDKIITRWDLAREQLKISLSRLTPEKYFSIVWFGKTSGTLEFTKGMIKATKGNIARVVAELEGIETKLPKDESDRSSETFKDAPDGILRGSTNMHSGLRRAYGLAGRGYVEEFGFVDPEALTEGCDTIFLLSDGAPSVDDFEIVDKDYGEGRVVHDKEYGREAARTPNLVYHGPYDQDEWLIEDVKRMNAFRRIRLHCIGLGEANMKLLRQLAEMGNGESFSFGDTRGDAQRAEDEKKERERQQKAAEEQRKAEEEARRAREAEEAKKGKGKGKKGGK
jgi:hypothetical protein